MVGEADVVIRVLHLVAILHLFAEVSGEELEVELELKVLADVGWLAILPLGNLRYFP